MWNITCIFYYDIMWLPDNHGNVHIYSNLKNVHLASCILNSVVYKFTRNLKKKNVVNIQIISMFVAFVDNQCRGGHQEEIGRLGGSADFTWTPWDLHHHAGLSSTDGT